MLLKSKFDVGDTVWYISNNKVNSGKISGVFIKAVVGGTPDVVCELWNVGKMKESDLFSTKKELIDTL